MDMNLLELQAAVLQLLLAERSEFVALLLKSIDQLPAIALEYPRMTSLGIAENDFDAARSEAVSLHEPRALRPIGLRAHIGMNVASIRESLVPLSGDDLEAWNG